MAAVIRPKGISVRGARPGEGRLIAELWRELWDAHEGWGGYRASHDDRIYDELAGRLDEDARVRASHPVLGRHVHLVASNGGRVAGQMPVTSAGIGHSGFTKEQKVLFRSGSNAAISMILSFSIQMPVVSRSKTTSGLVNFISRPLQHH